jgi:hypothetical protein
MDRAIATARTLWTTLQPDMPGIVAIVIAILTMILIICIGLNLAADERQWIKQEGMVGGMYPITRAELAISPATITLYSDPHGYGQPLTPTPPSCLVTLPVIENVPYDARWLTSRAGWSYGPMSGLHGLVGIGNPTP